MSGCGTCDPCENRCSNNCCKKPCLRWGFDGCYLRGRCADGAELDPLNLCTWLETHETCTSFSLQPDSSAGGYMLYSGECGNEQRIYVCDFLNMDKLGCIGDTYDLKNAESCDLLVFSPDCGDEGDPRHGKWSRYHIPDAGTDVMQADENGYFKVLTKNDCGCIEESNLFAQSTTWEYLLRDSWPDDPDWDFTVGSFDEVIDVKLDEKIPLFGSADLEVTIQYGYGIQHQGPLPHGADMNSADYHNFQSVVTPVNTGTETAPTTYNSIPVSTSAMLLHAITNQGCNLIPWGSWEWHTSKTIIVPKGQKLFLHHRVKEVDTNGNIVPFGGTYPVPGQDCSRLHQLRVFVKATKGVQL